MQSTAQKKTKKPLYSVKQAAELTGLTLNQIRLWERRYKLLSPHRDNNGYRVYSQDDVDILRYTFQQIQKGNSIQNVSDEVRGNTTEVLKQFRYQAFQSFKNLKHSQVQLISNYDLMINALEIGNPLKFEQLLIQAQVGKGTAEAFQDIELPLLLKIEDLTQKEQISKNMYEMAVAIIRRRVLNHIAELNIPTEQPAILFATTLNDLSEAELLFTMLAIAQQRIPMIYPGPYYSPEELSLIAEKYNAKSLIYFLRQSQTAKEATAFANELKDELSSLDVLICGEPSEPIQKVLGKLDNFKFAPKLDEVVDWTTAS